MTAQQLGDVGVLLLDSGASVTDTRIALEKLGRWLLNGGEPTVAVLPEIVIIREGRTGTLVIGRTAGELSFHQTSLVHQLVGNLLSGDIPVSQLDARIDQVRSMTRTHPLLGWVAGGGLVSTGLAVLFRCPWWAILLSLIVGLVVGLLTFALGRLREAAAVMPFLSALVSTVIVGWVAGVLGYGPVPLFAVCAPIAILVPGALITNALLELTATDIVTGTSRLIQGLIMLGFMAAGIAVGGLVTNLRIQPDTAVLIGPARGAGAVVHGGAGAETGGWSNLPPGWLAWIGVVILAVGIAAAFGAGPRLMIISIAAMMIAYIVLDFVTPRVGGVVAAGLAVAAVFLVARLIERITPAVPANVIFQPALLLLVPGTVGLVALATHDPRSLESAFATFASLCIGTRLAAIVPELVTRIPIVKAR